MVSDSSDRPEGSDGLQMTRGEFRTSLWLASLYGSRMLGMFLILPVFAVHAAGMPGGDSAAMVGFAFGVYGLTQAVFQLPFGAASDRFGRKPVIIVGLLLMLAGSLVAAMAETVAGLAVGRAIQGAGAISAALGALLADTTRASQRTKAMALVGAMIGVSFAISLVAAPLLYRAVGLSGLFVLTGLLAVAGIAIVVWAVPSPAAAATGAPSPRHGGTAATTASTASTGPTRWSDGDLLRLDGGIFVLHFAQTAMFVVIPARLVAAGLMLPEHWKIYLPVVIAAFAVMMPPLNWAERMGRLRGLFLFAVLLQAVTQLGFAVLPSGIASLSVLLLLFFIAFNMLEALIPSLVSRLAPAAGRGAAMGVYNTSQSLGIFAGGALGGVLGQRAGESAVFLVAALLMAAWFLVARGARRWPLRAGAIGDPRNPSGRATGTSAAAPPPSAVPPV
jgi:MFS family permease